MPRKKKLNIIYKNKTFYCDFNKCEYTGNSMVALLKNDINVYNYYYNKLSKELQDEITRSGKLNNKYLYKIISNKPIYCKYSNKLIPYDRVLRGCETFSEVEHLWGKGTATRGKKRPEHGILISKKFKGIKKSDEHRAKMTERLQSIDFKKTVLINKGINFTDDISVYEEYAKLYSELYSSNEFKRKFTINNFKFYLEETEITDDDVYQMNDVEICNLYSELMSIKSSIAMSNSTTMGNAKIVTVDGLNFNLRNLNSIEVRSSMEKKIISFFERNKIQWDYETEIIEYFFNFNRRYIMDFKFIIDGKCNFMEVKGSVRNADVNKTLAKTKTAIEKFGQIYVYQAELIVSINDLEKIKYDDFSKFTLKHVYGD